MTGKISQIIGAVVDVRFETEAGLPALLNALAIKREGKTDFMQNGV